jgi:hypothetical protein
MGSSLVRLGGADFHVFLATSWPRLAGAVVYVLCRRMPLGGSMALYVGNAGEISGHLGPRHEMWAPAVRLGMNEIYAHWQADRRRRIDLEIALCQQLQPPLNDWSPVRNAGYLPGVAAPHASMHSLLPRA